MNTYTKSNINLHETRQQQQKEHFLQLVFPNFHFYYYGIHISNKIKKEKKNCHLPVNNIC